jgi:hypothetical protein
VSTSVGTLHEQGRSALLAGSPALDTPPVEGGRRWGLSVVVRAEGELADRLAGVTDELIEVAGPGQWATGGRGSAHLTLYSLEPHRAGVDTTDERAAAYAAAVEDTARTVGPATFTVTGLSLTPGGVIADAEPADDAARRLRPTLSRALPGGAAFESSYRADRWWLTLVHLAAPPTDPAALVDWVEDRRSLDLGTLHAKRLELVRYEHRSDPAGARTVPVTLASTELAVGDG